MFTITMTCYLGVYPEVNRSGLVPVNDERDKYPTSRTFNLETFDNFIIW